MLIHWLQHISQNSSKPLIRGGGRNHGTFWRPKFRGPYLGNRVPVGLSGTEVCDGSFERAFQTESIQPSNSFLAAPVHEIWLSEKGTHFGTFWVPLVPFDFWAEGPVPDPALFMVVKQLSGLSFEPMFAFHSGVAVKWHLCKVGLVQKNGGRPPPDQLWGSVPLAGGKRKWGLVWNKVPPREAYMCGKSYPPPCRPWLMPGTNVHLIRGGRLVAIIATRPWIHFNREPWIPILDILWISFLCETVSNAFAKSI